MEFRGLPFCCSWFYVVLAWVATVCLHLHLDLSVGFVCTGSGFWVDINGLHLCLQPLLEFGKGGKVGIYPFSPLSTFGNNSISHLGPFPSQLSSLEVLQGCAVFFSFTRFRAAHLFLILFWLQDSRPRSGESLLVGALVVCQCCSATWRLALSTV